MARSTPIDPESPTVGGTQVWKLKGVGGTRRIAAWLWFERQVGDRFTMAEIRAAIGRDGRPDPSEHLNRRLRDLRKQGWVVSSHLDRSDLEVDQYELEEKGFRLWLGEGNPSNNVSDRMRRAVMERDGYRCTLCGIGRGEEYPDLPGSKAKMTVGHRHAMARSGRAAMGNLRTECARCNEPVRDSMRDADTLEEVRAAIRGLGRDDRFTLRRWIEQGSLERTDLQVLFDRVRLLSAEDQNTIAQSLR